MKGKLMAMLMLVVMALGAAVRAEAVEAGEVAYLKGTLPFAENTVGKFDTRTNDVLIFAVGGTGAGKETRIPYETISQVEAHVELARHLGVLPAIGVGLVRKRERKHMLSLTYLDTEGRTQVAVFEVSKVDAPMLLRILDGKASKACSGKGGCVERNAAGE